MKRAIQVVKEMLRKGIIEDHAIGGSVGVMFYTEPIDTFDLDFFVELSEEDSRGRIVGVGMISYLGERFKTVKGHLWEIGGIAVDFIPVGDALVEDAVKKAFTRTYRRHRIKVARPEHLLLIAVRTARPKDFAKVALLADQAHLDWKRLSRMAEQFGLSAKLKSALRRIRG